MSETQQVVDEIMQAFRDAPAKVEYQRQALEGAASYFEELATMGNPAPIAFAQAIRLVLAEDRAADDWADLAGKWGAQGVVYETALRGIVDGYGPNHLSKYARDIAQAALDEGKE